MAKKAAALADLVHPADGRRVEFSEATRAAIPQSVLDEIRWVGAGGGFVFVFGNDSCAQLLLLTIPHTPRSTRTTAQNPNQLTQTNHQRQPQQHPRRLSAIDEQLYRLGRELLTKKRAEFTAQGLLKPLPDPAKITYPQRLPPQQQQQQQQAEAGARAQGDGPPKRKHTRPQRRRQQQQQQQEEVDKEEL